MRREHVLNCMVNFVNFRWIQHPLQRLKWLLKYLHLQIYLFLIQLSFGVLELLYCLVQLFSFSVSFRKLNCSVTLPVDEDWLIKRTSAFVVLIIFEKKGYKKHPKILSFFNRSDRKGKCSISWVMIHNHDHDLKYIGYSLYF